MDSLDTSRLPEKRKRWLGRCAFFAALTAILLVLALGIYGFLAYKKGTLDGTVVTLAKATVILVAVLAALALIVSLVTFFLKGQTKGMAVLGLILSIVILLGCGGLTYAYTYVFGDMSHDSDFGKLSKEDLGVVEIGKSGEILRDFDGLFPEDSSGNTEETVPAKLVGFEALSKKDLPAGALAVLDNDPPKGPSYLTGNYDQITNFLLLGLDGTAADSIIIFSLDRVHQKLKMTSVARDSYLKIPIFGAPAKLAYTYTWGGPQLSVWTINSNFSMNIQDYIAVDLGQLAEIVDALGGVELELSQEDVRFLNAHPSIGRSFSTGTHSLNGKQTATYVRNRADSDAKRTERQRNVLNAIMLKLRDMPISAYPAFIRTCLGLCTTSLDSNSLMGMAMEVVQKNYSIESDALIDHMDYWGGLLGQEQYFYVVYDPRLASDWLYRRIYEDLYQSGYDYRTSAVIQQP